jgi:pyruvate formate lyase activating enzyme
MLMTDNYGELVSIASDPIEKKPLYHFYPGSEILSTGPNGCNLGCNHCQNWTISQKVSATRTLPPEQLVATALRQKSIGVAFTYTEPLIWYEYLIDCAPLLRDAGLKVVLVTNGYINPKPLRHLAPFVDAANVDLKGMRPEFYRDVCKGKLEPVLETIRIMAETKIHLEITNLVIPTLNDTAGETADLTDFIASVSDRIVLHLSAYRPDYKMDLPPTPVATLIKAQQIAKTKLKYVYLGNVAMRNTGNTECPTCGELLISRADYRGEVVGLREGRCVGCGFETGIVH